MYLGAGLSLVGAAILYRSTALLVYALGFLLLMHGFVILYEQPTLTRQFGSDYEIYRQKVARWIPHF
jgi:protein-S-isoprenylcysteine O-methyltransferase Ste14